MTDYSKIDFSKLKLPQWRGGGTVVTKQGKGVTINSLRGLFFEVAANREGDIWEVCPDIGPVTFSELDQLKAICAQVDAFIAAELKRIAEEALPPWRACTEEEARANPECSEYQYTRRHGTWTPIALRQGGPDGTCHYRTRAPKQEPKPPAVKAPEGCRWQLVTLYDATRSWCIERPSGTGATYEQVPATKEWRDAMLACVAAFDLENDLAFDIKRYTGYSYAMEYDSLLVAGKRFRLVEVPE